MFAAAGCIVAVTTPSSSVLAVAAIIRRLNVGAPAYSRFVPSSYGPAVETLIPEIPREEYVAAVGRYLTEYMKPVTQQSSLASQAYAVLSACRALYTVKSDADLSKLKAAEQAKKDFPHWRRVINDALEWRSHQWQSPTAETASIAMKMAPRSRAFVSDMAGFVRDPDSGVGRH
ncbi:aminoglycoside adenylyltransferase domain-containing protein [Candidatus Aeolococcus gillhamiae]|uniref:aminoglycoside adenylyltransferase domain-containing protein n=1 Tax=Candidatus Aeolococcus gillhamiae TaxID=3127015 RepID=UPI0030782F05